MVLCWKPNWIRHRKSDRLGYRSANRARNGKRHHGTCRTRTFWLWRIFGRWIPLANANHCHTVASCLAILVINRPPCNFARVNSSLATARNLAPVHLDIITFSLKAPSIHFSNRIIFDETIQVDSALFLDWVSICPPLQIRVVVAVEVIDQTRV